MCQLSALGCEAGQLNGWLNVVSDSKCNSSDSHATDGNPKGKGLTFGNGLTNMETQLKLQPQN